MDKRGAKMSADLQSVLKSLQARPKPNTQEQYQDAIAEVKVLCERIKSQQESNSKAWRPFRKDGKELAQLQSEVEALEASLLREATWHQQNLLTHILGDQQIAAGYRFLELVNAKAVEELKEGNNTIYIGKKDTKAQGYSCKIFRENTAGVSFHITESVYKQIQGKAGAPLTDILKQKRLQPQAGYRFEILPDKSAIDAKTEGNGTVYVGAKSEGNRYPCRIFDTKGMRTVLFHVTEGVYNEIGKIIKAEEEIASAAAENIAAPFKRKLGAVRNQEQINKWNLEFSLAIEENKDMAIQEKLRQIQKEMLKTTEDAFSHHQNRVAEKPLKILTGILTQIESALKQEKHSKALELSHRLKIFPDSSSVSAIEDNNKENSGMIYVGVVKDSEPKQYLCKVFDEEDKAYTPFYLEAGIYHKIRIFKEQPKTELGGELDQLLRIAQEPKSEKEYEITILKVGGYYKKIKIEIENHKEIIKYEKRSKGGSVSFWQNREKELAKLQAEAEILKNRLICEKNIEKAKDRVAIQRCIEELTQHIKEIVDETYLSNEKEDAKKLLEQLNIVKNMIIEFEEGLVQRDEQEVMDEQQLMQYEENFLGTRLKSKDWLIHNKVYTMVTEYTEKQVEAKREAQRFHSRLVSLQARSLSADEDKLKLNLDIAEYITDIDEKIGLANEGNPVLVLIKSELKVRQELAKAVLRQVNSEIGRKTAEHIAAEELKSLKSISEQPKEEDTFLGQLSRLTAAGDDLVDDETKIRDYIERVSVRIENTVDRTVKIELEKGRNEAQRELDEKRTFATYIFRPIPNNMPELLEKVIYFSKKDEYIFCQGLDPDGKLYEKNVLTDFKSSLELDVRLSSPDFQRDVLNQLAADGFVLYSVQQDWRFVLDNLCNALNENKAFISRSVSDVKVFHKELGNIGIFYENERYIVNLRAAESSVRYRDYICDPDRLINAVWDDAVARTYQAESERFHAEQFKFEVSLQPAINKNSNLHKAINDVSRFYNSRVKNKPVRIEVDRERAKAYLIDEAYEKLKKAETHIEEVMKQQPMLSNAYKQQKECVDELKVSDKILLQEDKILNEYKNFEDGMKDAISKKAPLSEEKAQKIIALGRLLEDVNAKNCKAEGINEKIRREKDTRYKMQTAIEALVSRYGRFAVKPTSLWTRISRSSRSIQLAEALDLIKNDIKNASVKMNEIRGRLVAAIESFKSKGDKNEDLIDFEEELKKAIPECLLDGMDGLQQERVGIYFDQDTIMENDLPTLNQGLTKCHNEIEAWNKRISELDEEIRVLRPQVEAISNRREKELVEKNNLQRVEKLKENSQRGQLIDAPNMEWLKKLSEKSAELYIAHRDTVSEDVTLQASPDLNHDQFTPIAEGVKEEIIMVSAKQVKNRAKWVKIADPEIDPNTGETPEYDRHANRNMGQIRKKHLTAVLEEAKSKRLQQKSVPPLSPISGDRRDVLERTGLEDNKIDIPLSPVILTKTKKSSPLEKVGNSLGGLGFFSSEPEIQAHDDSLDNEIQNSKGFSLALPVK